MIDLSGQLTLETANDLRERLGWARSLDALGLLRMTPAQYLDPVTGLRAKKMEMDMVNELTIDPAFLRRLVFKMRAVSLGDEDIPSDARDNAPFGGHHITLNEEVSTGATRDDLVEEINGMDFGQQQELVALMWVGRGDLGAGEWADALALAEERAETPTPQYLLSHPLAADDIASGLEALGHDHILQDGGY